MPSTAHESAIGFFQNCIGRQIYSMGIREDLDTLNTSTVRLGQFSKQADCYWGLNKNGVTFVVEAGLSESSNNRFPEDARRWIESNGSAANIAVTVDIGRSEPLITISKWVREPQPFSIRTRPYRPMAIRTAVFLLDRSNSTTRLTGTDWSGVSPTPTNQLVLDVKEVVSRDVKSPEEGDFVINRADMEMIARRTWQRQHCM